MKVKRTQLQEGCILSIDIKSLTNQPIIPKKTVINKKYLEILEAFLIKEVEVEPTLESGEPFHPVEEEVDTEIKQMEDKPLLEMYLSAVKEYKAIFKRWQAGIHIDIGKVRDIIVPLLEKIVESPSELYKLYQYTTKEDYLFHHSVSVAALSALIGEKLKYQKGDWLQIGIAGLLSDCGMSRIDPKLLQKETALTKQEYEEIKQHPKYSYNMLKSIPVLKEGVRLAVLQHHERIDGSGYPLHIVGEKLHFFGKIVAVADVYHAMISERKYKKKKSIFKVLESILQDEFGKFDHKVVIVLTKIMANFSSGTRVRLSNNKIGEIVFIEEKYPTRPMVKLLDTGEIIQLTNKKEIFIDEII